LKLKKYEIFSYKVMEKLYLLHVKEEKYGPHSCICLFLDHIYFSLSRRNEQKYAIFHKI